MEKTPTSKRKVLFSTPQKRDDAVGLADDGNRTITPTLVRNADRSARRKSNRRFLERMAGEDADDDAMQDEEDELAQRILEDEEADEVDQELAENETEQRASPIPETPVKRGRGRPKGSTKKKQRSPTPPLEMPPHEKYFWQNKPGGNKTSNNTLGTGVLLNHEEYFNAMKGYRDRHAAEKQFLIELHARSFDRWIFELEQGFSVCLYGYGSKRPLTERFAKHLHAHITATSSGKPKIIVANGFHRGITVRDILAAVASAALPAPASSSSSAAAKLPAQPPALCAHILSHLAAQPPPSPIHIVLNSLDAPPLRRPPAPFLLAQLASSPHITLLATCDTPSFPLLWDTRARALLRPAFHDATTFARYEAEVDAVEGANALLGRSGRRVGGKDGVAWVLRSLPENARSLFRVLVGEQLAEVDEGGAVGGVEYRVLYHRAVEEFVCSSEVGFRTLLKEFYDHQMVESRRDAVGTERLVVPFPRDELEGLLDDLTGDII